MKALKMKHPPHPGFSVRVDCLEPHGLSVTEGAKVLGRRDKNASIVFQVKKGTLFAQKLE